MAIHYVTTRGEAMTTTESMIYYASPADGPRVETRDRGEALRFALSYGDGAAIWQQAGAWGERLASVVDGALYFYRTSEVYRAMEESTG